jgi:hypothetical protein
MLQAQDFCATSEAAGASLVQNALYTDCPAFKSEQPVIL